MKNDYIKLTGRILKNDIVITKYAIEKAEQFGGFSVVSLFVNDGDGHRIEVIESIKEIEEKLYQ